MAVWHVWRACVHELDLLHYCVKQLGQEDSEALLQTPAECMWQGETWVRYFVVVWPLLTDPGRPLSLAATGNNRRRVTSTSRGSSPMLRACTEMHMYAYEHFRISTHEKQIN